MNPYAYEKWINPVGSNYVPPVTSVRRSLRANPLTDFNSAYQYWEGFESESEHVKNVQKVSAGKVLDQIRTLYPEGLGKKLLDLEAGWLFISEGIGICSLYVKYNLEEDSWSIEIKSPIYDCFNGYKQFKTLSFKTVQEVLSWLQTHPPKSVSVSIFELVRPVVFAYQNFRTGIDLEFNI